MKKIYFVPALAVIAALMSVNVLVSQNAEEQSSAFALAEACTGFTGDNEIYNSWGGAFGGETKVYDVWINDWCPNTAGSFDVSGGNFVDAQGNVIGTVTTLTANSQGKILGKLRVKWDNYPHLAGQVTEGSVYFNHSPFNTCWNGSTTVAFTICRQVMITHRASTRSANSIQEVASLAQNAPNPAIGSTNIRFYIPETAGSALLQLFSDSQLVNTWEISQRGEGEQVINTSGLRPGIYYYSLIVDGVAAGTKRMVVQ